MCCDAYDLMTFMTNVLRRLRLYAHYDQCVATSRPMCCDTYDLMTFSCMPKVCGHDGGACEYGAKVVAQTVAE
jgi:hypothetical protein